MKTYWHKIKSVLTSPLNKDSDVKEIYSKISNFLAKNSNSKVKLLQAGCGKNIDLLPSLIKDFQGHYFGVDSNTKLIKKAKKDYKNNLKIKFFKESLNKLNFKTDNFEIVLAHNIIEFEQYYTKILTELSRVCKKTLILSMSIKPSFFLNDKIKLSHSGFYQNRYNQPKLLAFLKKHHFKKINKYFEDWQNIIFICEK